LVTFVNLATFVVELQEIFLKRQANVPPIQSNHRALEGRRGIGNEIARQVGVASSLQRIPITLATKFLYNARPRLVNRMPLLEITPGRSCGCKHRVAFASSLRVATR
jgi:hypothetical protein